MDQVVRSIDSEDAPPPGGHYAQAVRSGGLVFISGQLPIDRDGHWVDGEFADQARCAISNLLSILRSAGGVPSDLLKVTVYVVGIENWSAFDRIYAEMLGEVRPARSVVPVPELHHGFKVEVDAIASLADR